MILRLAAIFLIASQSAYGQRFDSLALPIASLDTVLQETYLKFDSLKEAGASRLATVKRTYDSVVDVADERMASIRVATDSLEGLSASVSALQERLDSIRLWKNERIDALREEVQELRSRISAKVKTLGLPSGLQDEAGDFIMGVDKFDISLPANDGLALLESGIGAGVPGVEDLGGVLPAGSHLDVAENQIAELESHLTDLPANVDEAAFLAEAEAEKWVDVSRATEQIEAVDELKQAATLPDENSAKEIISHEVQQAIDHFEGKEEELKKAMETLARYKQRYSKLEGLDQIPRKRPNSMRDRRFMERIVPGIALQIHRKDAWMVDFNLYAGYRFNDRLRVGAGWNQRVAYDADLYQFDSDLRVFGPRLFTEFDIGRGFSLRVDPEHMNTRIPPRFASGHTDSDDRQWIYSTMAGIKKEYRFIGIVKGTMLLLYNLHDRDHRSPYSEKLMVRFGFEIASRPKVRNEHTE
jgi:hypothetical protein